MKQLLDTPQANIWQTEVNELIHHLPDNSIHALITDPPYASGGANTASRKASPATKYISSSSGNRELVTFTGETRDQRAQQAWLNSWLTAAWPKLADGALVALFTDWRQYGITEQALQTAGYTWRGTVVWHKPINRPQPGMFTAACEYIIWGTKGDTIRDKRYPKGFYSESAPTKRTHLTEKPVGVFRHLNQLARGTILDPFTGSGASVEAAILDGIPIIAGDLSPIYAQQAADRARALLGQQQAA